MHPRWREAYRSSAFRIAGLYSVLFVASLIALLSVIYLKSTLEFENDLRERVRAETDALLAIHRKDGIDGLVRAIAQRDRHDYFFSLENAAGDRLVSDLGTERLAEGWYTVEVPPAAQSLQTDTTTVRVLGTLLSDRARLGVGASNEEAEDLQEIIFYTSLWVVGLTAILALTGGLMIYRASMRRVDTIALSSQEIMTGGLAHRLPSTDRATNSTGSPRASIRCWPYRATDGRDETSHQRHRP